MTSGLVDDLQDDGHEAVHEQLVAENKIPFAEYHHNGRADNGALQFHNQKGREITSRKTQRPRKLGSSIQSALMPQVVVPSSKDIPVVPQNTEDDGAQSPLLDNRSLTSSNINGDGGVINDPIEPVLHYQNAPTPNGNTYYGLSEVAARTGSYPQYILTLINRYQVVSPRRSSELGTREKYLFTEQDIRTIQRVNSLTDRGRSLKEAVTMVKHADEYQHIAQDVVSALAECLKSPDDMESWIAITDALTKIPALDEREKLVFMEIEGYEYTIKECAVHLKLRSEKEAKEILSAAYAKVGGLILYLIKMEMMKA